MKKVNFTPKPSMAAAHASADAWVNDRHGSAALTKRFTFDVPISLHQRVKSQCALQSLNMAAMMREFLEERFPEEDQPARGGGSQSAD